MSESDSSVAVVDRTPYLRQWRKVLIDGVLAGVDVMTPVLKHAVIKKTKEWIKEKPEDEARINFMDHAIGKVIDGQEAFLLQRLVPRFKNINPSQLKLMHMVYSVNGEQQRLGSLTPTQIERHVLATLVDEHVALGTRISGIRAILKLCKHRHRPIFDQLDVKKPGTAA